MARVEVGWPPLLSLLSRHWKSSLPHSLFSKIVCGWLLMTYDGRIYSLHVVFTKCSYTVKFAMCWVCSSHEFYKNMQYFEILVRFYFQDKSFSSFEIQPQIPGHIAKSRRRLVQHHDDHGRPCPRYRGDGGR